MKKLARVGNFGKPSVTNTSKKKLIYTIDTKDQSYTTFYGRIFSYRNKLECLPVSVPSVLVQYLQKKLELPRFEPFTGPYYNGWLQALL